MRRGPGRRGLRGTAIVGALSLLFAGGAFAAATLQKDRYTAETNLVFRGRAFAEAIPGAIRLPSPETTPSAETTEMLLSLPVIAARTASDFPGDLSGAEISQKVDLQMHPGSELVTLRATDPNPNSAAAIANAYATEAIAFDRSVGRRIVRAAIGAAQGGAEEVNDPGRKEQVEHILSHLRGRLHTLEVLQVGDLEQVEPAIAPNDPSSPHVAIDVLFGLLVGICVGSALVGLAGAKERIDDVERLEAEIGASTIGTFTEVVSSPHRGQAPTDYLQLPPELVDIVWARIRYYEPEMERCVLLVTSASESEGKTTLSRNLVAAAEATGTKSTLIEGDRGGAMVGGLVDEAAAEGHNLIVVDGCAPFCDDEASGIPEKVDCVIVIGRIGRATVRRTRALRKRLHVFEAPVLGVVANFAPPEDPRGELFVERQADVRISTAVGV